MTGEHAQRARRPSSRPAGNRRRHERLATGLTARASIVQAAIGGLRRSLATILVCALIVAAGAGAWLAYLWVHSSPRFAVDSVEIRGTERASADGLQARLAPARGKNLFGLDLAALEAQAEREAWVATATIRRELPDHLVVEVTEHVPAAVVELGSLYLADARGRVFARAQSERDDLRGLPIVTGLDRAAASRDPSATAARVVAALAVAAAAWRAGDRPDLGEVHLDDQRGVTLYTFDPAIAVHLGDVAAGELQPRLDAFDAAWGALDAAERTRTTSIHLGRESSPARVTVAFADRK